MDLRYDNGDLRSDKGSTWNDDWYSRIPEGDRQYLEGDRQYLEGDRRNADRLRRSFNGSCPSYAIHDGNHGRSDADHRASLRSYEVDRADLERSNSNLEV